ncbi:MAG: dTDP-4-dehydrorhamnose reductase [Acidobacteriota bacterium]
MRVLLLGGSGQLGRELRPRLARRGVVLDPTRAELDLAEVDRLPQRLRDLAPELIVNAAADTDVAGAESAVERAETLNAVVPGLLGEVAAELGSRVLHVSTDYVFGGPRDRHWREDDPPSPLNVYGRTKLAGERALASFGAAHVVLRTSWLYSAEGPSFLQTVLRLAEERDELTMVSDQRGTPTSVGALAAIVEAVLDRADELFTREGLILHASCAGDTTWHGFAEAIVEETRARGRSLRVERIRPITSAELGGGVTRPEYSVLDLGRLRERLGHEPPPWREALRAVLER